MITRVDQANFEVRESCQKCEQTRVRGLKPTDERDQVIQQERIRLDHEAMRLKRELWFHLYQGKGADREKIRELIQEISILKNRKNKI
ncbi:hypothetical protein [Novosphingobium sp. AAP93]|uniref:hypothetical protein n=1 Tax=Novosphingobium sp. AAP93 TaxID=1523427 RepID=UPI0012E0D89C|nr:hypothetical protein [Novosphingobium sp. AAP93]